ncbi:hypothetical protein [Massilia litorea]|uniref:Uncharacterized protein n=1 Tax=Massilia litorea TaxID=2769491 RepID=A0A7L9U659_9BURK|nr:hypothetical protein [Massilia litorea]QOL50478.1 hypothetical protein LPB04_03980 [Massilia litorea]
MPDAPLDRAGGRPEGKLVIAPWGELPPWDRFNDAVLHGWGRIDLGNEHPDDGHPARYPDAYDTGFDDPGPAYRYGDEMAHTDKLSGLAWEGAPPLPRASTR